MKTGRPSQRSNPGGDTANVFVYGTLRKGFRNHHLLKNVRCLGPAVTVQAYALYHGAYPHVVKTPAVCPIAGEVYEVDANTLRALDELEDHPAYYRRDIVDVMLHNGERTAAWLYFRPVGEGEMIAGGDYASWMAKKLPE